MLVGQSVRRGERGATVGGAVIDDDDFDRPPVLSKHTLYRLAQALGAVVDRDDGADEVGGHYPSLLGRGAGLGSVPSDGHDIARAKVVIAEVFKPNPLPQRQQKSHCYCFYEHWDRPHPPASEQTARTARHLHARRCR